MTRWPAWLRTCLSGALAAALLLLLSGCVVPATPSHHGWLVHGERATGDVVSALGTTMLVLRTDEQGRLLRNDARATVAQAEATAGGAISAWGDEQPPRSEEQRWSRISTVLDGANSLLGQARSALLDEDPHACEQYCSKLQAMAQRVRRIEQALSDDADRVPVGQ